MNIHQRSPFFSALKWTHL